MECKYPCEYNTGSKEYPFCMLLRRNTKKEERCPVKRLEGYEQENMSCKECKPVYCYKKLNV